MVAYLEAAMQWSMAAKIVTLWVYPFAKLGRWNEFASSGGSSTERVNGGALATEGVRVALAQLLALHGMHVQGLEPSSNNGHQQTQNASTSGKW